MKISMPYLTPILTSGMACGSPARAIRPVGDVPGRFPRDVRRAWMDRRPSGESGAASFPRERGGAQERDVRRATLARRPSPESESTPGATTRLSVTGFTTPSPIPTRHRTRRLMRRRATLQFEFRLYSPPHMA